MERRAAPSLRGPTSPAGSTVRTVRFAKARSWGRRAVRRVRCENRFVARYGFNLATVLHHRRHPRPLSDLAHFEVPKRLLLLPEDFSVETGELTPTLKVKRRVVEQNHKEAIEALYRAAEAAGHHGE